jgi:hypothetical protein
MLPAAATKAIDAQLPFVFNSHHFTQLWRRHKIRPETGQPPEKTDSRYCVWSKPHRNHVYTKAWVKFCLEQIGTREKFQAVFGKDPQMKVTALSEHRSA